MSTLAYCPADDLARGACRTNGQCWGHECVGFGDCPCARCRHTRVTETDRHYAGPWRGDHESYCGVCRTRHTTRGTMPAS